MTKVVIDTEDEDGPPTEELPPVIEAPPAPPAAPDPAVEIIEEQLEATTEITATALDSIADDIGDLQEVVAALVSAMDSVVDYLNELADAEIEEGHQDVQEPTVVETKQRRVKQAMADVEPQPHHRYRTFMLGRSGGVFK